MVRATIAALLAMALLACSPGRNDDEPRLAAQAQERPPEPATPTIPPVTVGKISPTRPHSQSDTRSEEASMGCDASKAEWMIGEQGTDDLLARGAMDAGAVRSRFLRPGEMVTLEYDESRLNVDLDEDGRVLSVRCG